MRHEHTSDGIALGAKPALFCCLSDEAMQFVERSARTSGVAFQTIILQMITNCFRPRWMPVARGTGHVLASMLAICMLAACTGKPSPAVASDALREREDLGVAVAPDEATRSASLAGVVDDLDSEPADLAADTTYALPGLLRSKDTLDDLRTRYGAANVQVMDIDGAEGETSLGVVLFAADPTRRAEIFLRDEARQQGVWTVRVANKRSRWHLDTGVRLGMTLDALVALNGAPVSFNGLDWDYGGIVGEWHGGRLAQMPGDPVFRAVSLRHVDDVPDGSIPIGDGEYRSDDQRFPAQGTVLHVGQVVVTFE